MSFIERKNYELLQQVAKKQEDAASAAQVEAIRIQMSALRTIMDCIRTNVSLLGKDHRSHIAYSAELASQRQANAMLTSEVERLTNEKQAILEALNKAQERVKALEAMGEAVLKLKDAAVESDGHQYGTLSTGFVTSICDEAIAAAGLAP